jgi:hypothetical protein
MLRFHLFFVSDAAIQPAAKRTRRLYRYPARLRKDATRASVLFFGL